MRHSINKYILLLSAIIMMFAHGCKTSSTGSVSESASTSGTIYVAGEGVFRSTDGGQSWSNVLGSVSFFMVSFADADHGCAARGNAIHCTEDGGNSWPVEASFSRANHVQMASSTVGYAVSDGDVYKTEDGGVSWTAILTGNNAYGMSFPDANTGFLIGSLQGRWMLRTQDGGSTWETLNPPGINSGTLFSVNFPTNTIGYAGTDIGILYVTEDGGESWTARPAVSGFTFNSIAFSATNLDFGVAADVNEGLMVTSDGGQSWTAKTLASITNVRDVVVVGADKAYAVGDSEGTAYLAVSEDSGATWTEMKIDGVARAVNVDVIH